MNYVYPAGTITLGSRDDLPPGNAQKIISGAALDVEFIAITNGKLNKDGNDFEGRIEALAAVVDGGTF